MSDLISLIKNIAWLAKVIVRAFGTVLAFESAPLNWRRAARVTTLPHMDGLPFPIPHGRFPNVIKCDSAGPYHRVQFAVWMTHNTGLTDS